MSHFAVLSNVARKLTRAARGVNAAAADLEFTHFWHLQSRLAILIHMSDVTRLLSQIENGNPAAADQLLPIVYQELRKLAASKLAHENPGQTLQATALVHEAYLRLVGQAQPQEFDGRGHFFSAAAEAMRRILVERARQKRSVKRGGGLDRVEWSDFEPAVLPLKCDDLLGLDEALQKLQRLHPRKCELVKLRFFAGLTAEQAAAALGVSLSTAEKDWAYARSWLRVAIDRGSGPRP
jgi:RNA polymerase sigma factor (TIGR02999 family)